MKRHVTILVALAVLALGWSMRLQLDKAFFQEDCRTNDISQETSEVFRWHASIARGNVIEIKTINGDIHAEATSGNEVEVVAIKHGQPDLHGQIDIQIVKRNDGISICAVYPSDDPHRPNECRPRGSRPMNVHNYDLGVDFRVRVPWGVRFIGHAENGDVVAASLGGPVEAYAINGNARISTSDYAMGRTINGSLAASIGSTTWKKPLQFGTVNGSIVLDLPVGASAEVRAESLNGQISTDFPLTVEGGSSSKCLNATLGSGGRELALQTLDGSIRLCRAPQYFVSMEARVDPMVAVRYE